MTGLNMQHLAYRGDGPAMTDLIGGQVQVGFATMTASNRIYPRQPAAAAGSDHGQTIRRAARHPERERIRARLSRRARGSAWPRRRQTPAEIIERLNQEINAGLADPTVNARLADMGGMLLTGSPADFGKLIVDETEKWSKVIREAHIKAG